MGSHVVFREGKWYARVTINGRRVWRAAGTSEHRAHEIARELLDQRERGTFHEPPIHRLSLAGFAEEYLAWAGVHKRSADTDARRIQHLLDRFGEMRIEAFTRATIYQYQAERVAAGAANSTVNREVALLRKILSVAVDLERIPHNPLLRTKMLPEPPSRQPSLDDEDEARLHFRLPPDLRRLADLALHTGARESELLSLRWRDVDAHAGCLVIRDSKSGESRRVPLPHALMADLAATRGKASDLVAPYRVHTLYPGNALSHDFGRCAAKAGCPGLRFHDLRHVAASRFLERGASLPEIAALLGQKTLAMARRYSHASWKRLQAIVEG